jgi:MbtH protein
MSRGTAFFFTVLALLVATVLWLVWRTKSGAAPGFPPATAQSTNARPAAARPAPENLLLAARGEAEIGVLLSQPGGKARLDDALAELLVEPPEGDLLEDWRWLVGDKARIFKVTVFGDMLLADPNGQLHWLDIGHGVYEELPATRDGWLPAFYFIAPQVIHKEVLRELRAQDYALSDGELYDWIKAPMIGGTYTANNVQRGPIRAVIAFAGRLAKRKATGAPIAGEKNQSSNAQFRVVVNDQGQYSMMPVENELPPGWRDGGKTGTSQECVDYIQKVWKQPQSSRPSTSTSSGQG